MTTIRAFDGYLVSSKRLQDVVSPAYDSLTPEERHEFGLTHPLNYINAMRSVDEYPEAERPTLDEVLRMNAANLKQMLDQGDFEKIDRPSVFIYRLTVDGHRQTAVICEIPIDHYDSGDVLKHETTRSDKEDLLVGYLDVVGASSSPVCLAYHEHDDINRLVDSITSSPPVFDFSAHDDVEQTLWQTTDDGMISRFRTHFAQVGKTYLTDGHHRFAAGSRFARKRRKENPDYAPTDNFNYVLVALFPAHQLRILPFNRCVRDLNGLDEAAFLERLASAFEVTRPAREDAAPRAPHNFGMYLNGGWYALRLKSPPDPDGDPVETLDVTVLQEQILSPILGIDDVRSDPRLDYVSGDTGLQGLEKRCDEGWAVGFACHPTSVDELMRVADSGAIMPPKSTYFDPKMRSGIFLRLY